MSEHSSLEVPYKQVAVVVTIDPNALALMLYPQGFGASQQPAFIGKLGPRFEVVENHLRYVFSDVSSIVLAGLRNTMGVDIRPEAQIVDVSFARPDKVMIGKILSTVKVDIKGILAPSDYIYPVEFRDGLVNSVCAEMCEAIVRYLGDYPLSIFNHFAQIKAPFKSWKYNAKVNFEMVQGGSYTSEKKDVHVDSD